ncbi:hypothetical protein JVX98_07975 [Ensifer sp. PDNC004]|uniref:hypothetical protein n=1 Tax=Ensifer sp. PDNC004 TaxID=2811423 RepID=UPI001962FD2E|nr:hypothetical protein [Ensifer sp. PDNC004]QRY68214.1 hypothetical protein JVX98_07975 [Ensifer sp. PDNC004]
MSVDGPKGGRGKWSQAGVPHKGWTCINVEDLGEPSMRCQMCEAAEIRYVHYMTHPQYPDALSCGAVCAGHLEEDLLRAEERDKSMRSTAGKRKRFPLRSGWALNRSSNPQITVEGFRVTMFSKGGFWKGVIHDKVTNQTYFTRDRFHDLHAAKMAAFDTLSLAKSRRPLGQRPHFPSFDDLK